MEMKKKGGVEVDRQRIPFFFSFKLFDVQFIAFSFFFEVTEICVCVCAECIGADIVFKLMNECMNERKAKKFVLLYTNVLDLPLVVSTGRQDG